MREMGTKKMHRVAARIECAYLRFSRRTQPSTYQATTPPIRPAPFTSAADRRDPRRAAFCVAPATRWSTRAVPDLVCELVRVLQVQCLQRSGVSPLRTRRRPLCEASRVHDREIFSCPVSYLASRTLVGDEHPLVWRVVHRQSRPGRGEIDTGGVHGEATVTNGALSCTLHTRDTLLTYAVRFTYRHSRSRCAHTLRARCIFASSRPLFGAARRESRALRRLEFDFHALSRRLSPKVTVVILSIIASENRE
ncbi:unnamed protein product [Trichogramma brassicae]|uniref:Uncharacterized protein n=1 Tax=Trichogramma brassicae TaxID=86971 RepID=A0A6H5IR50_9HYME|nr:unnamed protein product [Trichogramma brassicae]